MTLINYHVDKLIARKKMDMQKTFGPLALSNITSDNIRKIIVKPIQLPIPITKISI